MNWNKLRTITYSDDVEKSTVSYTVLTVHAQHEKRRPHREHRCGAGQVLSEG